MMAFHALSAHTLTVPYTHTHTPSTTTMMMMPRQESWPPTKVRFGPSVSWKKRGSGLGPLLEDIDENPLTYFLTPLDADDMGLDDDDMFFDAGIEDASQPREAVRSVSPSSLEGLRKASSGSSSSRSTGSSRPMSPDLLDLDVPTTDDDDDDDYLPSSHIIQRSANRARAPPRRRSSSSCLLLSPPPAPSLLVGPTTLHARTGPSPSPSPSSCPSASASTSASESHPSAAAASSSSRRGRPGARAPRWPGRGRVATRPNHLWTQPSPDVWSIEEETEEELLSEAGSGSEPEARKTKKRVRFVLPE